MTRVALCVRGRPSGRVTWTAEGEQRLEAVAQALSAAPQDANEVAAGARRRGFQVTCHGVVFMLRALVLDGRAQRVEGTPVRWCSA